MTEVDNQAIPVHWEAFDDGPETLVDNNPASLWDQELQTSTQSSYAGFYSWLQILPEISAADTHWPPPTSIEVPALVLLIEVDVGMSGHTGDRLSKLGCVCRSVSLDSCLDALEQDHFDVVVIDSATRVDESALNQIVAELGGYIGRIILSSPQSLCMNSSISSVLTKPWLSYQMAQEISKCIRRRDNIARVTSNSELGNSPPEEVSDTQTKTDNSLQHLWTQASKCIDDDKLQQQFIQACIRQKNISYAVECYRALKNAYPDNVKVQKYLQQVGTILGFYAFNNAKQTAVDEGGGVSKAIKMSLLFLGVIVVTLIVLRYFLTN